MSFGRSVSVWTILHLTAFRLGGLFVLVAVGVWLVVRVRRRLNNHDDPRDVDHTMLIQMRELHRAGNLSEEEFRSIKGRLIERLDQADVSGGQNAPETQR